ncbi:hypothetical protein Peur_061015 [Populus x canadensis]
MPRFRQDRAPIKCTSTIFVSEALHSIKPTDQSGVVQSFRFRNFTSISKLKLQQSICIMIRTNVTSEVQVMPLNF